MKKFNLYLYSKIAGIIILNFLLFSCNPLEKDYKSNSFIIIENIIGKDLQGNDSSVVFSDVVKVENGQNVFYSDFVTVTLRAALLDPNPIMGASQYNDIMLTRYVVTYTRSDGATTEGTAVPYHFEGSLSTLLPVGSTVSLPLMIVRDIAKSQPPLDALIGNPTGMLECTARIDFYGHDLRNREVTQVGYITVRFADYIDQQ
ncbi:MAG: hypothetical protein H5U06_04665 [Candidatus Aminicenantes bacterium]|nr:hypothetical protein [Candidatus Aminicenantes bacterium]